MFGKNEIVGQRYFRDAPDNSLFVTSRFMTIQGEGPFRGQPAFFIRLAKCNLACSFCDTFFDDGDWMTFDEIENAIEETINEYFNGEVPEYARDYYEEMGPDGLGRYSKQREMVLVITGGEPMLQKNLGPFLEIMSRKFQNTQIESNGTVMQEIPQSTVLVISPKCAEKNGKVLGYLTPRKEVLLRADYLKFVMSADENSPYSSIPDWAHTWCNQGPDFVSGSGVYRLPTDIFISPMNIYNEEPQRAKTEKTSNEISIKDRSEVDEVISFWTPGLLNMEQNQKNHEYTARYCLQHGFTLNLQMHLYAGLA